MAYGADIGKAIYSELAGNSTIITLIGSASKIQPSAIYTASPTAGIFYDILSVDNENTKTTSTADLTAVTFQIECFMTNYKDLIRLGTTAQGVLDKIGAGTYNGVQLQSCVMQSQSTDFDGANKLYYMQTTYKARVVI
jgi:hypothetical protein